LDRTSAINLHDAQLHQDVSKRAAGVGHDAAPRKIICPCIGTGKAEAAFRAQSKAEEVNGKAYKPIEAARGNIGIFIDQIYNGRRLHSAIHTNRPLSSKPNSASTADISA
jgi:hypothetical protein